MNSENALGLLGHAPAGVVVEMPHKKLPKQELPFSQKLYNQLLVRATVIVIACGLHNRRVLSPHRAYLAPSRTNFPGPHQH